MRRCHVPRAAEALAAATLTSALHSNSTPGGGDGAPPTPPAPVLVKGPEYDKLAGYFNLDNGTGKIRGVYLQGNDGISGLFRQWLAPFRDLGAETLTLSNTGGTDHLSF